MKLAVFDFDGTLNRVHISMAFSDWLFEKGLYKKEAYQKQTININQYKEGNLSYADLCYKWAYIWSSGLEDQQVDKIGFEALAFYKNYRKNIFPVSYELVKFLKRKNYYMACLSIAAYEVLSLAANDLQMNEFYATRIGSKNGLYTGKVLTDYHKVEGKELELRKIMCRKDINYQHSIGFGDEDTDISFLDLIDMPVAVNPSKKLLKYAREKNWPIIDFNKLKPAEVMKIIGKMIS